AEVWQPAAVKQVGRMGEWHRAKLGDGEIAARLVVDTHGSWLAGPFAPLPPTSDRDLLGFKARFAGASLPRGLMPLVLFPGGYGGLVHTDGGDVSFSCCIGYGVLRRAREGFPSAGEAVLAHVSGRNRAFRETLSGATLRGSWLAAGPIRPGFRTLHRDGVFAAGNAAGEAHPLVAEGIAMAIQSGWLLARHLASATPLSAARGYARDWRRHFARRIRAAQLFESLAATAAPAFVGAVRLVPAALTWGAWASGKSHLPAPELA
ncbi:MAG TPA: hypothetical protein VEA38_11005, partial [Terriglobales bacterium]|nr:hypothetical protein [Terriglobales bacterium]